MSLKNNLLSTAAIVAVSTAFGAAVVYAQATADTDVGTQNMTLNGDIVGTNTQLESGSVTADTGSNLITDNIVASPVGDDTVGGALDVLTNVISASATGNTGSTTEILAFPPATAGDTAVVGNLQSVEADSPDEIAGTSTSDTVSILVENSAADVRTFTGTAEISDNEILASGAGNDGTSSISIASGVDVDEDTGGGQASAAIDTTLVTTPHNLASGDLVVSSSQEIDPPAGSLDITGTATGAAATATIERLSSGTVTVSGNDQGSTADGNIASSSIVSDGTTGTITGSAVVSNLQTIDPADGPVNIGATTSNSEISASAGTENDGDISGDMLDSTMTVSGNTQSSDATGNDSTQAITLNANQIIGEGGPATSNDSNTAAGGVQLSASGDAVIANVQREAGATAVTATTQNNTISASADDGLGDDDITTSEIVVDGNSQTASATGARTSNALSLTSGATQSAAGVVASVQNADSLASVSAVATGNTTTAEVGNELVDSSLRTTGNAIGSTAIGGDATNTLSMGDTNNNLSAGSNAGTTLVNDNTTFAEQPDVVAAQVVTNDQSRAGSVSASSTDNQVVTSVGGDEDDATTSTVTTDGNSLSASATGQTADNSISLAFNNLIGDISASGTPGTGTVASVANEQDLTIGSSVTARNVGTNGLPVLTVIGNDSNDSGISTSNNTVSVTAVGNATTGNDVTADATNIEMALDSDNNATPDITIPGGEINASGSFVSASSQVSSANILASQLSDGPDPFSNSIETQFGDDIDTSSSVVSDENLLSASASANRANNAVALGGDDTATIQASAALANYQGTTQDGSIDAEIGVLGADSVQGFTSLNAATTPSTQSDIEYNSGTGQLDVNVNPIIITFDQPLTQEEADLINGNLGGWSATAGSNTVSVPTGTYNISTVFTSLTLIDPSSGGGADTDESITIAGFEQGDTPGTLNDAGVIVRLGIDDGPDLRNSTVSVSDNVVVGETNGNVAESNSVAVDATTVVGLTAAETSIDTDDTTVGADDADVALSNLQESAAPLSTDVAASFAVIGDDEPIQTVTGSTQSVNDNLQQSFATANRATNEVTLEATNTDADTGLESVQISTSTVATTSDMDVVGNAAGTDSSLEMDGNQNQSVATANVVSNAVTLDVTNANESGTPPDATINSGTAVVSANNVLSSVQTSDGSVQASATTDVYNQDVISTSAEVISNSDVSASGNETIAQATANEAGGSTNTLTLGNAGTANMDRTGALSNVQVSSGTVEASVDEEISIGLENDASVPVQSSSITLDGNFSSALARGNNAENVLTVNGANIDAGSELDAVILSDADITLNAAGLLASQQSNTAAVTGQVDQSRIEVDMDNADGDAIANSTLSVSGNTALATARGNTVVNTVSSGADASNVDATTALGNLQENEGAVQATGGSAVGVYATASLSGINGSSVDVSGNLSASNAEGNRAVNTLSATGTNINSGDLGAGGTGSGGGNATVDASATGLDVNANAGNLLVSFQDNGATVTSTNTDNTVTVNGATSGVGAAALGTTLAVTGNAVEARATGNLVVNNSVNVGDMSTASTGSTGLVVSFQDNNPGADITASASTQTTVSLNGPRAALGLGTTDISDNSVVALARGNVAQNVLSAEGANVDTGSTNASTSAGLPDSGILNASFGVFNEQVQRANVEATSADARIALNATSSPGEAMINASSNVSGNSVQASAFGNVATNSLTLTALNGAGNDATMAAFNGQVNTGNITASATGAVVGTFSTGHFTNASASASGNSISATAVGNFSRSSVTRSNR
ncbi:hypothetical protein C6W92_16095 [Roseovarius sp. A46]|uniref:beta strand repeat-containing protein n=1 Tax=Roseovarius sp. A46 TaxID=2109331 RepID=UPI001010B090|nr:S-layer family protein [Roseovarius sp. A46]RXV58881.1 hypothetical protein C6W92_16095 [Roseovarius sp. A46]